MKLLLVVLFAGFGLCAVLTLLCQIRYGHFTGSDSAGIDSPAARKCRHQAVCCAVAAALFLIAACFTGAWIR